MPTEMDITDRARRIPRPSPAAVLKHLSHRTSTDHGEWFTRDARIAGVIGNIEAAILEKTGSSRISWLKRGPNRFVARYEDVDRDADVLVKFVFRKGIRRQWFRRCPILEEASNQLCAFQRHITVPQVLAYGRIPVTMHESIRVLCMQWMPMKCMRDFFLDGINETEITRLLRRAAGPIVDLYSAACNHVDFGPHAILLNPRRGENDAIIDFDSATFLARPSPRVLAAQVGYFGWSVSTNRHWVSRTAVDQWRDEVFQHASVTYTTELSDIYHANLIERPSLKVRMARC